MLQCQKVNIIHNGQENYIDLSFSESIVNILFDTEHATFGNRENDRCPSTLFDGYFYAISRLFAQHFPLNSTV